MGDRHGRVRAVVTLWVWAYGTRVEEALRRDLAPGQVRPPPRGPAVTRDRSRSMLPLGLLPAPRRWPRGYAWTRERLPPDLGPAPRARPWVDPPTASALTRGCSRGALPAPIHGRRRSRHVRPAPVDPGIACGGREGRETARPRCDPVPWPGDGLSCPGSAASIQAMGRYRAGHGRGPNLRNPGSPPLHVTPAALAQWHIPPRPVRGVPHPRIHPVGAETADDDGGARRHLPYGITIRTGGVPTRACPGLASRYR